MKDRHKKMIKKIRRNYEISTSALTEFPKLIKQSAAIMADRGASLTLVGRLYIATDSSRPIRYMSSNVKVT